MRSGTKRKSSPLKSQPGNNEEIAEAKPAKRPKVNISEEDTEKLLCDFFNTKIEQNIFNRAVKILSGDNPEVDKFKEISKIGKLFSASKSLPSSEHIDMIIPYLVKFLKSSKGQPSWECTVTWLISAIVAGYDNQSKSLLKEGAIPPLIELLSSSHPRVSEMAAMALGNFFGDGKKVRKEVIKLGVVPPLVKLAVSTDLMETAKEAAFAINSLICYDYSPKAKESQGKACLPALARLIDIDHKEIQMYVCETLNYISGLGTISESEGILEAGILPRLIAEVEDFKDEEDGMDEKLIIGYLGTLGNIVATKAKVMSRILNPKSKKTGRNKIIFQTDSITKSVALAVSIFALEDDSRFDKLDYVPISHTVLAKKKLPTHNEVLFDITKLIQIKTSGALKTLSEDPGKVLPILFNLLRTVGMNKSESVIILNIFEALEALLKFAKSEDKLEEFTGEVECYGGLDVIEMMQDHKTRKVYRKAYSLLNEYFKTEKM